MTRDLTKEPFQLQTENELLEYDPDAGSFSEVTEPFGVMHVGKDDKYDRYDPEKDLGSLSRIADDDEDDEDQGYYKPRHTKSTYQG